MEQKVQAVFENGALRPLQPLRLKEQQHVMVTVSDCTGIPPDHPILVSPDEWMDAACDNISIDEVRRRLSTIRGSLSQAILDERQER